MPGEPKSEISGSYIPEASAVEKPAQVKTGTSKPKIIRRFLHRPAATGKKDDEKVGSTEDHDIKEGTKPPQFLTAGIHVESGPSHSVKIVENALPRITSEYGDLVLEQDNAIKGHEDTIDPSIRAQLEDIKKEASRLGIVLIDKISRFINRNPKKTTLALAVVELLAQTSPAFGEAVIKEQPGYAQVASGYQIPPEIMHLLGKQGAPPRRVLEEPQRSNLQPRLTESRSDMPVINSRTRSLLESSSYPQAQTPEQLKAMYDKFNERDADPADDAAVAFRYQEFLSKHSAQDLIRQYGKETAERLYQEAGFATWKAVETDFAVNTRDGRVPTEDLENYLSQLKKAQDFYDSSISMNETQRGGSLNKAYNGLIDMNNAIIPIATAATTSESHQDRMIAAEIRDIVNRNVYQFHRLRNKGIKIISAGEGKYIFPNTPDMAQLLHGLNKEVNNDAAASLENSWMTNGPEAMGGMIFKATQIIDYFKRKNPGTLTPDESLLLENLVMTGSLIRDNRGVLRPNPEIPEMLFTDLIAYAHESTHIEYNRNPHLWAYWTNEWNNTPQSVRLNFVASLDYLGLSPGEIRRYSGDADLQHIKRYKQSGSFNFQELVLNEFTAYSSDNSDNRYFNPRHEIRKNL